MNRNCESASVTSLPYVNGRRRKEVPKAGCQHQQSKQGCDVTKLSNGPLLCCIRYYTCDRLFFFLLRVYLCALLCPKLPRLLFFFVNNDVGFQKLKARGQWMMPSQLELLNAGLAFISVWAFS